VMSMNGLSIMVSSVAGVGERHLAAV